MLRIEAGLVLLAILISVMHPSLGSRWFAAIERRFSLLSQRPLMSVILIGTTALVLRAALLPALPIPEPIVHDEFGYLLAADTFAHGRLTNPTHPMWIHFESFGVLQKPMYESMYPPAQGIFLAVGKLLFGHPFWGVWLSVGLMCAAITWMLQGWLPPEWALIGGILALLRYGVFNYWVNSYWGGAVAAMGGALVLGALPRINALLRRRDALIVGLGLALLASSRPYEGLVFSLPVVAALGLRIARKNGPPLQLKLRRIVVPLAIVSVMTGGSLGYYFSRVTGSPFRFPHQIERQTYAVVPLFVWQHLRPEPLYHNDVIKKVYAEQDLQHYKMFKSPTGYLAYGIVGWSFFLGPALTLPLVMLFVSLPRHFSPLKIQPTTAFLLFEAAVVLLGSLVVNYYSPHYSAPGTGLILLLVILAMKQMRAWSPSGRFLARAVPVICILTLTIRAAAVPLGIRLHDFYEFAWHETMVRSFGRQTIKHELEHLPGKHLVIVHYRPDHDTFNEFVYNDADIDNSKIVWAREIGPREDQDVMNYFKDRKIWTLQADEHPPRLEPRQMDVEAASKAESR
jgi:hypothetical protein